MPLPLFLVSFSLNLTYSDELTIFVSSTGCGLGVLGIDRAHGEPLQGQRYEEGQRFREHADFFYIDQPYWAEYEPHGGQRTWTAMIYLNQPEEGGATRFKTLGKTIQPEIGKLLAWNNLLPDGRPNPATLHQGMKVRRGTKYVLTKWFRQRPL